MQFQISKQKFLIFFITLFIISCVFDPADKIIGAKEVLFILVAIVFLMTYSFDIIKKGISKTLFLYTLTMIGIPLLSVLGYYIFNGSEPYAGLILLKAYIFISLALVLNVAKLNFISTLCRILNFLSLLIVVLATAIYIYPELLLPINIFGDTYGVMSVGERPYGDDLVLNLMYYVTSPLLVIPIAFYMDKALKEKNKFFTYLFLALFNCFAMFLAGTRSNMFIAIFLPAVIVFFNSKNKIKIIGILSIIFSIISIVFSKEISIFLSLNESSNSLKVGFLYDYLKIFSDPVNLFFGQGLGSYYDWESRGFFYISELTYLEIFRNLGLIMGLIMLFLIFYPIIYIFLIEKKSKYHNKNIIFAYIFHLIVCITNPLLFSNIGMTILSIIMADIFNYRQEKLNKYV